MTVKDALVRRLLRSRVPDEVQRTLYPPEVAPDDARMETPEGAFAELFFEHHGHLAHKLPHYFRPYDRHFGPYRGGPVRFLELGVFRGGSLALWRKFFGPTAQIWGIDVEERCASLDGDFEVRIGSQDDPAFLRAVVEEMGGVDIVLDDASHLPEHQRASLATLFPLLGDGGLYVVEDLCTSYWTEYHGGLRSEGFMATIKDLVDDMHGWHHDGDDRVGLSASRSVESITVYDSIAFIQKGSRRRPIATRVGTPAF